MWLGQHKPNKFHNNPPRPVAMARRKNRMFKQISNVHVETVADAPDWSSFLKIDKQDSAMKSAYIDKVRISWVLNTDEGSDNAGTGLLFCASHDNALDSSTPSNNDGQVIAASASRGGGGVVTLDIKRRVTMDYDGSDASILQLLKGSSGAPVFLHIRQAEKNQSLAVYMIIETWGRWFEATSL